MGGAWLTGGLEALARETGWDPGSADHIVGTSAGSMMGALLAAGIPPWFMVAHSAGEVFEGLTGPDGRAAAEADRSAGAVFRLDRRMPRIGPGSWSMIARGLTRPGPRTPDRDPLRAAPRGPDLEPSRSRTRSGAPCPAAGPSTRASGSSPATTRPAGASPFGRPDAPAAEIGDAVAASCAIPGFYRPVTIGGRRYVDGGVWSTSNLDILRDEALDLVICLNPTSSLHPPQRVEPGAPGRARLPPRVGARPRQRGQAAARGRHRGRADPADRRGPRRDGRQPDGHAQPQPGHRDGDRDGRPPAARAGRHASCCATSPRASRTSSRDPTARPRPGPG